MHRTTNRFWLCFDSLPFSVQKIARKNFELLKGNEKHPSLHFKRIGGELWSVRVGRNYRALGVNEPDVVLWFWIGTHNEYDKILARKR